MNRIWTRVVGAALFCGLIASVATSTQYPNGPGGTDTDTLTIVNIQNDLAVPHPIFPDTCHGIGGIVTGFDAKASAYAFSATIVAGI